MKKLISIILAIMFVLCATVSVSATQPYSQDFETKEELLDVLGKYAQAFPNNGYVKEPIKPLDRYCNIIDSKTVVLPELSADYATCVGYSYAETVYGCGVNNISSYYLTNDTNREINFCVYYHLSKKLVLEELIKFENESNGATVFRGAVDGYDYRAYEVFYNEKNLGCKYVVAYGDLLITFNTEDPFNEDFINTIEFNPTTSSLALYCYSDSYYKYRFVEEYRSAQFYDELYYHHTDPDDDESPIDWALIHCVTDTMDNYGDTVYAVVFDTYISQPEVLFRPFPFYAIYDVEKDMFIDIVKADESQYKGMREILAQLKLGTPLGDLNKDGKLTVADATCIQRAIADIEPFPENDTFNSTKKYPVNGTPTLMYYSDFNLDHKRTIADATAIQRKIAGLDI